MKLAGKTWMWMALAALGLAIYAFATRKKVIGTVDASGAGLTVNGS